jgi:integrase/recombinase XerD
MKTYPEPSDVTLMEEVATNLRDQLMIHLTFHLGCRISEALALTIEDVDFEHGTVTIRHLKASLKLSCTGCGHRLGKSHLFCPGCGSRVMEAQIEQQQRYRQRALPIDAGTLRLLKEYVGCGGPVVKGGRKVIFGINRHRAWQIVKECAEKAGLPKLVNPETGKVHNISPHRLRDGFAVHAVKLDDSGDGLRLLQEHLGHRSFNTTARYRKISGTEHQEWYSKLWSKRD